MSKGEKKKSFYMIIRTIRYLLPITWKVSKIYYLLQILKLLADTILPFVEIFCMPLIIKELCGPRRPKVAFAYVMVLVLGKGFLTWVSSFITLACQKYEVIYSNYLDKELSRKGMELDFANTEDKQVLDQVEKAKQGISWYSQGIPGIIDPFFSIIRCAIILVGVFVIILKNAPIMILVSLVVVAFQSLCNRANVKIEFRSWKNLALVNRAFSYILFQLTDFQYAKDIRLYDASDMMLDKTNSHIEQMNAVWDDQAKAYKPIIVFMCVANILNTAISTIYLGIQTIRGIMSVAIFTKMINSVLTFTDAIGGMVSAVINLSKHSAYINEYINYMEYPSVFAEGTKKLMDCEHTIEFRNVSFTYPRTDVQVLKNLSITLNPGEHLSVVGLNGAGKTTFIKLLCRLYDVDSGEILLDGININEYDYNEYMKLLSVIFQDFKIFAFSFKDNIVLNQDENKENIEEICQTVGLDECVNSLVHGVDTMLMKYFDKEGVELSGGQQQKLAIARALFKNSPIVILDEPTAALDPIAEYEIYKQFDHLVGGKTAVYISHRLSSCKFCDHIAVFADGTIKEYGTHEELVNIPEGIYATMFQAQAQYYQ